LLPLLLFALLATQISAAINWKNIAWAVTNSMDTPRSPGNNYWDPNNAYIDHNDALRLNITFNSALNRWYSVQLQAPGLYSYGVYQWQLGGRLDKLDINVVLGLFLYPANGPDGTDEIDIEFSQWADVNEPGLGLTVWPNHHTKLPRKNKQVPVSPEMDTTARFTWTPGSVVYEYFVGHKDIDSHDNPLDTFTVSGDVVASDPQYLLMNFWIFRDKPKAALDTIISNFEFKPLSSTPDTGEFNPVPPPSTLDTVEFNPVPPPSTLDTGEFNPVPPPHSATNGFQKTTKLDNPHPRVANRVQLAFA
jgi:hypothetical protein